MIMTIILSTILVVLEILNLIKLFRNKKTDIFLNSRKILLFSIVYIFIISIVILIIKNDVKDLLLIILLVMPLSFNDIKLDNEKYIYLKKIITDKKLTKETVKKFNKAGIHFVVRSNNDLKFKKISLKEYKKINYEKNAYIEDKIDKKSIDNSIIYNDDFDILYNEIRNIRGIVDNYVKSVTFVLMSSLLFSLSYVILLINGFPFLLKINDILLIKLLVVITSRYLYRRMPYDSDLMNRRPREVKVLFGIQGIFLMIFQLLVLLFGLTIVYMSFLSGNVEVKTSFVLFMIMYLYMLFFYSLVMLTEKILIKNMLYLVKNIYLVIYLILVIGVSLLIDGFWQVMAVQNYFASIAVALVFVVVYDFIKFARYTTIRKDKKNGIKNNKKKRRS